MNQLEQEPNEKNVPNQDLTEKNVDNYILKAIFPEDGISVYGVWKKVDAEKGKKSSYRTMERHVLKLSEDGLIRKMRSNDARGTWNLKLTMKGLVFIILNAGLSDADVRKVFQRFLKGQGLRKLGVFSNPTLLGQLPVNVLRKALIDVRPKVNIDFYDEKYAMETIANELLYVATYEATKYLGEQKDSQGKPRFQHGFNGLQETVSRDALKIPEEYVLMLRDLLECRRKEQGRINKQVADLDFAYLGFKASGSFKSKKKSAC